jgi:hypothetical protein
VRSSLQGRTEKSTQYAEAGEFKAAIAAQEKALKYAALEEQFGKGPRARLQLFRKHKPFREKVEVKRE